MLAAAISDQPRVRGAPGVVRPFGELDEHPPHGGADLGDELGTGPRLARAHGLRGLGAARHSKLARPGGACQWT